LHDAIYLKIEQAIDDNYRGADGTYPVSPSAVGTIASLAALAAIEEERMVVVSAEDLRVYVTEEMPDFVTYATAQARLRAALPERNEAP